MHLMNITLGGKVSAAPQKIWVVIFCLVQNDTQLIARSYTYFFGDPDEQCN